MISSVRGGVGIGVGSWFNAANDSWFSSGSASPLSLDLQVVIIFFNSGTLRGYHVLHIRF